MDTIEQLTKRCAELEAKIKRLERKVAILHHAVNHRAMRENLILGEMYNGDYE
jgi:hypothetical protein